MMNRYDNFLQLFQFDFNSLWFQSRAASWIGERLAAGINGAATRRYFSFPVYRLCILYAVIIYWRSERCLFFEVKVIIKWNSSYWRRWCVECLLHRVHSHRTQWYSFTDKTSWKYLQRQQQHQHSALIHKNLPLHFTLAEFRATGMARNYKRQENDQLTLHNFVRMRCEHCSEFATT